MDAGGRDLAIGCGCALVLAAVPVGFLTLFIGSMALGSGRTEVPMALAYAVIYGLPAAVALVGVGLVGRGFFARGA